MKSDEDDGAADGEARAPNSAAFRSTANRLTRYSDRAATGHDHERLAAEGPEGVGAGGYC